MMIHIFLQGFLVSFGLIVAIGAQNAYVLKQGLKKEHVFILALICALCDGILIFLGVKGVGVLIAKSEAFLFLITLFGIIFLLAYGLLSLKHAFSNEALHVKSQEEKTPLKKSVLTILALTLLNPHVYLDTFLLVGSIGGGFEGKGQNLFVAGAILASFTWFFGLGYGARILAPFFKKPKTWMYLDIFIACVMFFIAFGLTMRIL